MEKYPKKGEPLFTAESIKDKLEKDRMKTQEDFDRENNNSGDANRKMPWTAEGFYNSLEEDRKKSQEELFQDHLERQRQMHEQEEKDTMTSKSSAPYKVQEFYGGMGKATLRVAPGYENAFGDSVDPNGWKEPTSVDEDEEANTAGDSDDLLTLKKQKAELERQLLELENKINNLE